MVALLAEGVDRNANTRAALENPKRSPSSRRAWIEMQRAQRTASCTFVALLAEGVDRNEADGQMKLGHDAVALLAEGVDRNLLGLLRPLVQCRRPPRGGRG